MCGRYTLFTGDDYREMQRIVAEADERAHAQGATVKTGEIYPTNLAPILLPGTDGLQAEPAVWGYPGFKGKGVIINARAETALEKRTFREGVLSHRCVIPTTGFYEWDASKAKFLFRRPGSGVLYLAGLYQGSGKQRRYVILTTAPNASVSDVHNRMPLILPDDKLFDWGSDAAWAIEHLRAKMPSLVRSLSGG
ncbi:MAG: SOS response-associated peptidase [Christensenellales bacterium]|jgi:putative SOS response-associated peptidase YedK